MHTYVYSRIYLHMQNRKFHLQSILKYSLRIQSSNTCTLDPAMVEMILFCKLNFSLIPSIIPAIATAAINEKIPMRLRDPDLQDNLQHANDIPADIDSNLEEENNFEDDI